MIRALSRGVSKRAGPDRAVEFVVLSKNAIVKKKRKYSNVKECHHERRRQFMSPQLRSDQNNTGIFASLIQRQSRQRKSATTRTVRKSWRSEAKPLNCGNGPLNEHPEKLSILTFGIDFPKSISSCPPSPGLLHISRI